jgi:hypothetical protein
MGSRGSGFRYLLIATAYFLGSWKGHAQSGLPPVLDHTPWGDSQTATETSATKALAFDPEKFARCLAVHSDPEAKIRISTLHRKMSDLYRQSLQGASVPLEAKIMGLKFVAYHSRI